MLECIYVSARFRLDVPHHSTGAALTGTKAPEEAIAAHLHLSQYFLRIAWGARHTGVNSVSRPHAILRKLGGREPLTFHSHCIGCCSRVLVCTVVRERTVRVPLQEFDSPPPSPCFNWTQPNIRCWVMFGTSRAGVHPF